MDPQALQERVVEVPVWKLRRKYPAFECTRCGSVEFTRQSGHWTDEDYRELLAEYFEMARRARRAEARLIREEGESQWWREQANWAMDQLLAMVDLLIKRTPEKPAEIPSECPF